MGSGFQGIVLAGGKSSRFGEDKALARIGNRTLIEIAVRLLDELDLRPAVIANEERDYSFLDCPIYFDLIPEKGPMGGLYTASCLFKDRSLVVLSCDMPAIDLAILKLLLEVHDPAKKITLFSVGGQMQPFPGVYEAKMLGLLLDKIRNGQLSMHRFVCEVGSCAAISASLGEQAFANINRKEDIFKFRDVLKDA